MRDDEKQNPRMGVEPKGIVMIGDADRAPAALDLPEGWDAMPKAEQVAWIRRAHEMALAAWWNAKLRGRVECAAVATMAKDVSDQISDAELEALWVRPVIWITVKMPKIWADFEREWHITF